VVFDLLKAVKRKEKKLKIKTEKYEG